MKDEIITEQTILKGLKELVESDKRLQKQIAESDQRFEKKMADRDKRFEKQMAKTNASIEKVNKLLGGIANNQGLAAEEEFFNSFVKSMRLGDIEFHSIERNTLKRANGIQDEFDIVMTNSDLIMIAEVKFKFHPKDVKTVLNKVSNFKKLYPQYQHYKIYGAVAGKILPQETIEKAKNYNLFVVAQEGNNLRVLNAPVR